MSNYLVCIVTLLYSLTSLSYFYNSNTGMGIVFAGYALANIGLLMAGVHE